MRSLIGLFALLSLVACGTATGDIYAVLVAGSNGWWNYRHQADVFHSYQVLIDHGVKANNIITFAYDDVANNEENPFPGKVFNEPNGVDVYSGVKIDYSGDDVNPDNFLAVLKGDKKGVSGGNGRVLESTKDDKVFIYFADHGATGLIAFPWDELVAEDLNATLAYMYQNKKYSELVFYLEACESGSMFNDILPDSINILAVTAANETESSWGCYCDDPVIQTCLGDTFSVGWLQDSDVEDLTTETLQKQYEIVKKYTDQSNVKTYGNLSILPEFVANFQGHAASRARSSHALRARHVRSKGPRKQWASRDIPLKSMESKMRREKNPAKREELARKISTMQMKQRYHDEHTRALVSRLVKDAAKHEHVMTNKPSTIKDLSCHSQVVKAYSKSCFNLGQNSYALNAVTPLTNLCNEGVEAKKIVETIKTHCARKNVHMTNIN